MADILELTETEQDIFVDLEKAMDDVIGEPPTHRHYFSKEELEYNKAFGTTMKALCGYEKVDKARQLDHLPICPKCRAIYEGLDD